MVAEVSGARDRIVLVLAFNESYLAPASTVIRSCLLQHEGEELRFEVIHDESLSSPDLKMLEEMCRVDGAEINFHLMDEGRLQGLPVIDRFGLIVWSRLFLPDLLQDTPRALYLDCDVLVLSSLRPLWQEDLGTSPLGAVANVVEPAAREHVARMGVSYPGGFFNSGVILFQLDRMREEQSTAELVNFALQNGRKLVWPDQDALNVVFSGRWHSLHPRWNAQNSLWSWRDWAIDVFGASTVDEAVSDPAIRHFEGPSVAKPWHYLCPAPHRDAYRETLALTPWADEPLQDRTLSTMVVALLPGRWRLDVYRRLVETRSSIRSAVERKCTDDSAFGRACTRFSASRRKTKR